MNNKKSNFYLLACLFIICNLFTGFNSYAQPANDEPCNAIELISSDNCTYQNQTSVGTTNSSTPSAVSSMYSNVTMSYRDVWFKITVPSNGILIVDTQAGSLTDANMVMYSGATCNALTILNCNEDTQGNSKPLMPIIAQNNLTPGSTVWIRIGSTSSLTGTFGICVTSPSNIPNVAGNPPASDDCGLSQQICNLEGYNGSTVGFAETTSWPELQAALPPNTALQNDAYISITAATTSISFDVWMTFSKKGQGVQIFLLDATTCGSGPAYIDPSYWTPLRITHGAANITFNGLTIGKTYYLIADGAFSDEATFVIGNTTGLAVSTYIIQDDQTICLGSSTNLTCEGASGNYAWTDNGNGGLASTNTKTVSVTPTDAGTIIYTVSADQINSSCPSPDATATLIVINTPLANAGGNDGVCLGDSYTIITASSNVSDILWSHNGDGTLMGSGTLTPVYTPAISDDGNTVEITLTAGVNCTSPDSDIFYLTVADAPDFNLGTNFFICPDQNLLLQVVDSLSMSSIDWTQNGTTVSNYFKVNLPAGTYSCRIENATGCSNDTTFTISTQNSVVVNQSTTFGCSNSFLMSTNTGGSSNGTNGLWTFTSADGTASFASNSNINTTVTFSNFGTYVLTFTDNNCPSDNDVLTYTYSNKSFFKLENDDFFYCPSEGGQRFKIRDSLLMNGISWNWASSPISTNFNSTLISGTHNLRLENQYGCMNDTTIVVTSQEPIILIDPTANKLCRFNPTDEMAIVASSGSALPGTWSYTTTTNGTLNFTDNLATSTLTATELGPYTIIFTDDFCLESDEVTFIVTPGAYFNIQDYKVCEGYSQLVEAFIDTPDEFIESLVWSTGATGKKITVDTEGDYTLTMTTGCGNPFVNSSFVDYRVCDIDMPNVITPNNDGVNDFYIIKGDTEIFKKFNIIITNRWGNVITEYNDPSGKWDGTNLKGEIVDEGVYFYNVQAETLQGEELVKKGFIHVIKN